MQNHRACPQVSLDLEQLPKKHKRQQSCSAGLPLTRGWACGHLEPRTFGLPMRSFLLVAPFGLPSQAKSQMKQSFGSRAHFREAPIWESLPFFCLSAQEVRLTRHPGAFPCDPAVFRTQYRSNCHLDFPNHLPFAPSLRTLGNYLLVIPAKSADLNY